MTDYHTTSGETQHTAEHITLCAVNTGALYPLHLELARKHPDDRRAWLHHTLTKVMPSYRRDMRTTAHVSAQVISEVAEGLRAYYRQHLAEF